MLTTMSRTLFLFCLVFWVVPICPIQGQISGPTLTIDLPIAGDIHENEVIIKARVQSSLQVNQVRATVGSLSLPLNHIGEGVYSNTLNSASLGFGNHQLTVEATDQLNQTAQDNVSFKIDRPPVVTLHYPKPDIIGLKRVRVVATATDDDPAVPPTIEIRFDLTSVHKGQDQVDITLDLPSNTNRVGVIARATDSIGKRHGKAAGVFVEQNPEFSEVFTAPTEGFGSIMSHNSDFVLFTDIVPGASQLKVWQRQPQLIPTLLATDNTARGGVTALGAIYTVTNTVFEWRPSEGSISIGNANFAFVRPNYAAWQENSGAIHIRHLTPGVSTMAVGPNSDTDLKFLVTSGDLLWTKNQSIQRWRAGSVIEEFQPPPGLNSLIGDENSMIFSTISNGQNALWRYQSGSFQKLTQDWPHTIPEGLNIWTYNTGWLLYMGPGPDGGLDVFRRSPTGTVQNLTRLPEGQKAQPVAISTSGHALLGTAGGLKVYPINGPGFAWPSLLQTHGYKFTATGVEVGNAFSPTLIHYHFLEFRSPQLENGNRSATVFSKPGRSIIVEGSNDLQTWTGAGSFENTSGATTLELNDYFFYRAR